MSLWKRLRDARTTRVTYAYPEGCLRGQAAPEDCRTGGHAWPPRAAYPAMKPGRHPCQGCGTVKVIPRLRYRDITWLVQARKNARSSDRESLRAMRPPQ